MIARGTGHDEHGGGDDAPSPDAWARHTLDEILEQLRRLVPVDGCAFQVVDWRSRLIRPAAGWFADDEVRAALEPVLTRPYEPERPGVTEAAIERGGPLLIRRIDDWPDARALEERLRERLDPDTAERTWAWYRASSFISVPVRTAAGRTLGVLAISRRGAEAPAFDEEDLRVVVVFAGVAAVALERAEHARDERLLNRAAAEVTRLLDPDAVYAAIVEQAKWLADADKAVLARFEPATQDLRVAACRGFSPDIVRRRVRLGEGLVGEVALHGEPYLSRPEDADRFLSWAVAEERIASFVHVPIRLGPRLFGVLNVSSEQPGHFDEATLALLVAFGRSAAAAIANALDFHRERRLADALTRGFVPGPAPALPGFELGLVYEPAGEEVGGGDVFGAWMLPGGAAAVLIGDVSGKGLEVAAVAAMVRFFVEARTWDCDAPAVVLAQTAELLARHLPSGGFVSAFLALIGPDGLRYCNAGHGPPVVLAADGGEVELPATGLPLGVEDGRGYRQDEVPFRPGDVLFAATDGLAEARRDGAFFGAARLPRLLAEHGRRLAPQALVGRVHEDLHAWTPRLADDVVILVVRRR